MTGLAPCPHAVTSDEGTGYCVAAEAAGRQLAVAEREREQLLERAAELEAERDQALALVAQMRAEAEATKRQTCRLLRLLEERGIPA